MSTTKSTTRGPWKYEASTKTIRSARENYWLASMNSFDGAVDHEANAQLIARAPMMRLALEAIATMATDEATDYRQLVALIQAIAMTEIRESYSV